MNLAHAATLLFETLMSAKEATNDKLQGRIVLTTYLRCRGVVSKQIRSGLLLSVSEFF